MTQLASCSERRVPTASSTWRAMTASVASASRSASVSPTQTMGTRPAPSAATRRLFTVSLVSPKYWRRSEWPTITYTQPASFNMLTETSPVNAPFGSQCTFCAPSLMVLPAISLPTTSSAVKGGARTISRPRSWPTLRARDADRGCASLRVPCIFQLPAMRGMRLMPCSLSERGDPGKRLPLEELERGPAARGDVGHGIEASGAAERRHRVAAPDDGRAPARGERGRDGHRTGAEGVDLEDAHGAVPEDRAAADDLGRERLLRRGPDVDAE